MGKEYDIFLEVEKHHKASLDASDRVIKLLEEQNASLSKELSERCESFDIAKGKALDAAIRNKPQPTYNPNQSTLSGPPIYDIVKEAQKIYEWLIKTDNP